MQEKKIWPWQSELNNNVLGKDHYLRSLFSLALIAASFPSAQDTGSAAEWALQSAPFLAFLSYQTVICYFLVLFFIKTTKGHFSYSIQAFTQRSYSLSNMAQMWPLYSNIHYLARCLHQGSLLFRACFFINKPFIYLSHQQ